jgi:hypothetical protein
MRPVFLEAARQRPAVAALASVGIFLATPLIQLLNSSFALKAWYLGLVENPFNALLYVIFSVLFGFFIALYLYSKNKCIDCKPAVRTGIGGSAIGFLIGMCPACFPILALVLPLSGTLFLTQYSYIFIVVSIAIILFSIYKMGGFRKISGMRSELKDG